MKLEAPLKEIVHIVCENVLVMSGISENISILRLKDQDRFVACVNVAKLGDKMLIDLMLACGMSLLVCADNIRIRFEHLNDLTETA